MSMLLNEDAPDPGEKQLPQFQRIGMWDQERESPLLYAALYAVAMLCGLLGHHAYGWVLLLWAGA